MIKSSSLKPQDPKLVDLVSKNAKWSYINPAIHAPGVKNPWSGLHAGAYMIWTPTLYDVLFCFFT